MTQDTDNRPLHDQLLAYPEADRTETYLSFCSALIAAPEGTELADRYQRVLDRLALVWQMSDADCDRLMKLARTNWQAACQLISDTVHYRCAQ